MKNYELFFKVFLCSFLLVLTVQPDLGWSQDAAHSCPGIGTAVRIDEPSWAFDFAYARGYLFRMDNLGLTVWSLEDPDFPTMVSAVPTERGMAYRYTDMKHRLFLDDRGFGYALVLQISGPGTITCFDLRNPLRPRKIWTSADQPGFLPSYAIAVTDTTLVSQGDGFSVQLVDVSNPHHPVLLDPLPQPLVGSTIAVSESVLFLVNGLDEELYIFDIHDARNPRLLAHFPEVNFRSSHSTIWVGSSTALIYSTSSYDDKVGVVDFSDLNDIVFHHIGSSVQIRWIDDVVWIGTRALVSGTDLDDSGQVREGIFEIDFSNVAVPIVSYEASFRGFLALTDNRLYSTYRFSGEVVAHELSPGLPQTTPSQPVGTAEQVVVEGVFGYVADGAAGLQILDVSDPLLPIPYSRLPLPGYAEDIVVKDGFAYVAADDAGLAIVDIRDPAEPYLSSTLGFEDRAYDLDVSGGTVVVTTRRIRPAEFIRVEVVDVVDPIDPVHAATVLIEDDPEVYYNAAKGVAIDGQVAWIAVERDLMAIDISEPSNPQILGELEILTFPGPVNGLSDVALLDGLALVTGYYRRLYVIDISDPTNPTMHSELNGPFFTAHVNSSGSVAVLNSPGITVIDFSDPDEPIVRSMKKIREGWGSTISSGVLYSSAAPFIDVFTLECRPPVADFDLRKSGQNYWFTNTSQYYFEEVIWDFGDGSEPSTEFNPSHRFPSTGEFTVTLQISGDQGSDSVSQVVTVTEVSEIFKDGFELGTFDDWSTVAP